MICSHVYSTVDISKQWGVDSLVLTNICCNFRVMMLNLTRTFSSSIQPSQSLEFWFSGPEVCWAYHSSLPSRSRHPPSSLLGGRSPTGSARCTSTSQLLDFSGTHCMEHSKILNLLPPCSMYALSALLYKTLHTSNCKLSIAYCPTFKIKLFF